MLRLISVALIVATLCLASVADDDLAALKQKAENGDAAAAMKLGEAYEFGHGVKADKFQAADWYSRAAEAGNAEAQNVIGVKLRTGDGTRKDPSEAVNWFRKAAKQGNAGAMFNLGTMYYNGEGVLVSDQQALAWFIAAKEFGSKEAPEAVERSLQDLNAGLQKAAISRATEMLIQGTEVPAKPDAALPWLNRLVDAGDRTATVRLGWLYLEGKGVPQDTKLALQTCKRGADDNIPLAMVCLGYIYRKGIGTRMDSAEAAKWYEKASNCGHAPSMIVLSEMYANGEGVKQDKLQQYALLTIAGKVLPEAGAALDREREQMSPKQLKEADKRVTKILKNVDTRRCNREPSVVARETESK